MHSEEAAVETFLYRKVLWQKTSTYYSFRFQIFIYMERYVWKPNQKQTDLPREESLVFLQDLSL